MASPLKTGKQAVDLAGGGVRVSRIRRDPPPKVKPVTDSDLAERDARIVAVGVVAFAIAITIIIIGFAVGPGWSPSQHPINLVSES